MKPLVASLTLGACLLAGTVHGQSQSPEPHIHSFNTLSYLETKCAGVFKLGPDATQMQQLVAGIDAAYCGGVIHGIADYLNDLHIKRYGKPCWTLRNPVKALQVIQGLTAMLKDHPDYKDKLASSAVAIIIQAQADCPLLEMDINRQ